MNLKCRYNPAHTGPFSNAVVLAQHYEAVHSDEYTPPVKIECTRCGRRVSDMKQHMRKFHHETSTDIEAVPRPEEPERVQWAADHIVMPVMNELAGGKKGVIPVSKLPSVFAWREATQKMLDDLQ